MMAGRVSLARHVVDTVASPTLLVAVVGVLLLAATLRNTIDVARRGDRVHAEISLARAQLAAETALAHHAAEITDGACCVDVAGLQLTLEREGDGFVVTCCDDDTRTYVFVCPDLAGGGPVALAYRRAARDPEGLGRIGGGLLLDDDQLPEFDPVAVASAPRSNALSGFRRDNGIALHYLATGTDRDDWVWMNADPDRVTGLRGGLLVVPGHLWLPPGDRPFELELAGDVVMLVEGNLYLGRSLRVVGPGRLLLVTTLVPGTVVFADRDGSGGWSRGDRLRCGDGFAGPAEGAGNVYLGLPGRSRSIVCQAGVVVAGELHVAVDVDVRGPLILQHGITDLAPGDRDAWVSAGDWVFQPGRECIPGLRVSGPPRPGLLQQKLDR